MGRHLRVPLGFLTIGQKEVDVKIDVLPISIVSYEDKNMHSMTEYMKSKGYQFMSIMHCDHIYAVRLDILPPLMGWQAKAFNEDLREFCAPERVSDKNHYTTCICPDGVDVDNFDGDQTILNRVVSCIREYEDVPPGQRFHTLNVMPGKNIWYIDKDLF